MKNILPNMSKRFQEKKILGVLVKFPILFQIKFFLNLSFVVRKLVSEI